MKVVTMIVALLFLSIETWSHPCDFISTGGKKITTILDKTTGGQAQSTILAMVWNDKLPLQTVKDEAGVDRYQKVESLSKTKTYSTSRPDCNDHYTAKYSVVCTKSLQDNLRKTDPTSTCVQICEQYSYSDDCR